MWANFSRHTLATYMNLKNWWSEALETCQTTEWPGHSESYNTLKENGDMVNGEWQTGDYHTIWQLWRCEFTSQSIWNTKDTTPDHMKECLPLSELQSALSQLKKNQEVFRTRWSHKEMLAHLGNSAICKLLEIYGDSWSLYTLIQIWWEAIMMYISWCDFWQEAHM